MALAAGRAAAHALCPLVVDQLAQQSRDRVPVEHHRVGHSASRGPEALGADRRRVVPERDEQIRDRLTQLAPIFLKNKDMLGADFSMLDVAIAPLLWRIDCYGI